MRGMTLFLYAPECNVIYFYLKIALKKKSSFRRFWSRLIEVTPSERGHSSQTGTTLRFGGVYGGRRPRVLWDELSG